MANKSCKLFEMMMKLTGMFLKPFGWVANKLEGQYDGPLRGIPQTLFVLGIAAIVMCPFLLFLVFLALQLPPPYCYLLWGMWMFFLVGLVPLLTIYVTYTQKRALTQSFSKEIKWDLEKHSEEYLDTLKKHRKRH